MNRYTIIAMCLSFVADVIAIWLAVHAHQSEKKTKKMILDLITEVHQAIIGAKDDTLLVFSKPARDSGSVIDTSTGVLHSIRSASCGEEC